MAEHTREEWLVAGGRENCVWAPPDTYPDNDQVAECPGRDTGPAKARQIVREHNAHPGLVAACKMGLGCLAVFAEHSPAAEHAVKLIGKAIADAERSET